MAGNLTNWEVQEFKEAFALFDTKKDGSIDGTELKQIMDQLGQECSDEEIKDMINEIDNLGTERIDFPSFLKQFQHVDDEDHSDFIQQSFDLVGNGNNIGTSEIESFFKKIDQHLIPDELKEIVQTADDDKDGSIGIEDFKKLYLKQ